MLDGHFFDEIRRAKLRAEAAYANAIAASLIPLITACEYPVTIDKQHKHAHIEASSA